ncbi:MAG: hypothetical protein ACKO38_05945 [Planctomycetota bacterium]
MIVAPRAFGWAIAEKTFGFGKAIAAVAERVAHATMRQGGAVSKSAAAAKVLWSSQL